MRLKILAICLLLFTAAALPARAHFQMIVPSVNIVTQAGKREIGLEILFAHPFERSGMDMGMPVQFGVLADGNRRDLLPTLKPATLMEHKAFTATYIPARPADYLFFVEPQPYWEPAEDCFIVHYAKTIVSAFGSEEGWDAEVGLPMEIVPLTRPYGLYAGNLFSGIVKRHGKPLVNAVVEVEYDNRAGAYEAPADSFVTQVVKTDANGVFHHAIPWAGSWGFAALSEDDRKIGKDGQPKSVEIGGVIWIQAQEPKKSSSAPKPAK